MNETESDARTLAILDLELTQAAQQLFEDYGFKAKVAGTEPPGSALRGRPTVVSIIGYASEQMRGALALVASPDAVLRWQPGLDAEQTEVADDIIAEFSNMLLGRFKSKLLERGVALLVATPTTASGANMTLRPPAGLVSRWHRFDIEAGPCWVRLDATFDVDFSLEGRPLEKAPAAAGDMMLF